MTVFLTFAIYLLGIGASHMNKLAMLGNSTASATRAQAHLDELRQAYMGLVKNGTAPPIQTVERWITKETVEVFLYIVALITLVISVLLRAIVLVPMILVSYVLHVGLEQVTAQAALLSPF